MVWLRRSGDRALFYITLGLFAVSGVGAGFELYYYVTGVTVCCQF
jgi:hypothetical protein